MNSRIDEGDWFFFHTIDFQQLNSLRVASFQINIMSCYLGEIKSVTSWVKSLSVSHQKVTKYKNWLPF